MRLVLLLAVIALIFDAVSYDGYHTQSAFRYLTVATGQLTDRIGLTEHAGTSAPDREPAADTTRL